MTEGGSKFFIGLLAGAAIAAATAISAVQAHLASDSTEFVIREGLFLLAPLAAPVALVLAFHSWATIDRAKLGLFRNGLGLASLAVLALVVLLNLAFRMSSFAERLRLSAYLGQTLTFVESIAMAFGFVLAFSLRGNSRTAALATALLVFSYQSSGFYI